MVTRLARVPIALALCLAALAGPAAGAALAAGPTYCTGTVTGVVPGDLIVPPGAACFREGATVEGNVEVRPGARFEAVSSTIEMSARSL